VGVRVVVAPTWPLVEMEALKLHLRVDDDDGDALIEIYALAASEKIDGPVGDLGHAFGIQDLELTLANFDRCGVELPYPPLREILSLTYFDQAGVEQELDPTVLIVTVEADHAVIRMPPDEDFPAVQSRPDAIKIVFRAGYDVIPAGAQAAIMLMVGDLYENRETVGSALTEIPMSMTVTRLLGRYRHAVIA
jgi:uncharacterized phiE125 gp8 family phage protein